MSRTTSTSPYIVYRLHRILLLGLWSRLQKSVKTIMLSLCRLTALAQGGSRCNAQTAITLRRRCQTASRASLTHSLTHVAGDNLLI
ncbi:hypothetical protein B0T26DRAFT_719531 [Lasiosphaeria miniovina]|uniref:Uncharacterized protein n=1 Tax=Lasiosphaeria miniovina TaxID=1954250 RepID=A0AA40ADZ3_9PEZI|nr:uncharacterized protein B0T26DRAFT_719531 [Lasiosphaeria miniovina]KAK0714101.1 hypothetical protein B0T26DRAFT_719531 [Lasiosphaeria miniovina]